MALMDKPTNSTSTKTVEMDVAVALDEGSDVAEENLKYSGAVAYITSQFARSKTARQADEARWLMAYRNYRGIYGPEVQFTDTEKSKAFVKITKTKVLAAYAQMTDVLFAGSKFPVGIEARKYPNNVADAINFDPNAITSKSIKERVGVDYTVPRTIARPNIARDLGVYKELLSPVHEELAAGAGVSPGSATFEPAKEAARRMERKMHDQLDESQASKHLRSMAFECALFGEGIIKGPFAQDKEYPRWDDKGNYDPIIETIPKVEYVSVWDFYPDPDARNMDEAEYTVQRHRHSRTQLRALKKRPHFRSESINAAVEMGPSYIKEHWENALEDHTGNSDMERFEVLEYWGVIDRTTAEQADIDIPKAYKDFDEIQVNIWICNGQILRLVMNPFTPSRIPYHAVPYELNPYSFFGIGVAENMEDTQLLLNGFMRLSVDNAALSGNLLIEIDETNLVPGQDLSVYPGKVFRRQAGAPGQAIFGTKFPNVSQELMMMFDKARQLADESTGIPSFTHGSTGVTGVGRTAAGMSMLMGAAAANIKAVVRNIDDYLLAPIGKAMFAFNMQFNFDKEFIGDLDVVARGTESLMRNEIRSQRLLQFMQMTSNPQMAPFVKYDYILRELASSMDLDEDKVLNDQREATIQAKMMAEIQALMPEPPKGVPVGGAGGPEEISATNGGEMAPSNAPEPGDAAFTGGGGGDNGGNQPQSANVEPQQPPAQ